MSVASVDMEAAADDDCHVDGGVARVTRRRRMLRFIPPLDKMPRWDIIEVLSHLIRGHYTFICFVNFDKFK